MRRDHRPYWMHQAWERYENAWARHFLHPHFERIGPAAKIVRPWHVEVFGPNIAAGTALHVIASRDSVVRFTVWAPHDREAAIEIGDACLFSGGTRILAAKRVTIGHACIIHACTLEDGAFVGMGASGEGQALAQLATALFRSLPGSATPQPPSTAAFGAQPPTT